MKKDNDPKKLSRAELLEMLIDQTTRVEELEAKVRELEEELHSREIKIGEAGSIAEAALRLSGVFEAAEEACRLYKENMQRLGGQTEAESGEGAGNAAEPESAQDEEPADAEPEQEA